MSRALYKGGFEPPNSKRISEEKLFYTFILLNCEKLFYTFIILHYSMYRFVKRNLR